MNVELKASENELIVLNNVGWTPNILEIGVSKVRIDMPEAAETPTERRIPLRSGRRKTPGSPGSWGSGYWSGRRGRGGNLQKEREKI